MSLTCLFFGGNAVTTSDTCKSIIILGEIMYLSAAEVLGITIALASSIFIMVLTTIANYRLQQDNKLLRLRLKTNRRYWEARVNHR